MKIKTILLLIVLLCSSLMYAIPWPISPAGSTHSLHHSYGDYHNPWIDASSGEINFHYGIDIADPYPLNSFAYEPVYAVYGGTVTYVEEDLNGKGCGILLFQVCWKLQSGCNQPPSLRRGLMTGGGTLRA